MKKVLYGTTALFAAGALMASPASAEEKIKLGLGGYMEQWVGFNDQDDVDGDDNSGIGMANDSEVFFVGETTLDNGIDVGVNIQLEGNTSGDQIDESYLYMEGSFGQILLGSENSAQYKMGYAAPDVGIGVNSGDTTVWASYAGVGGAAGAFRGAFGSTAVEAGRANDVNRLTYFTPRISGFQLGASYAPQSDGEDGGVDNNRDRDADDYEDGFSIGANYVATLGGVDVAVAGGYGRWNAVQSGVDDPEVWNVGLNVGFSGFTVGASYASEEGSSDYDEAETFDVGVSYATGPFAVSVTYLHAERDGGAQGTATNCGDDNGIEDGSYICEADLDVFHISGAYTLGPGIKFKGTVGIAEISDESGDGEDNNAVYVVFGPALSF
jgi:predicted porin